MSHLKKGADGHLLKAATGHLIKTCGIICPLCSGSTPQSLTAVASGITLCSGCWTRQSGSPSFRWITNPSVGPNGSFVMPIILGNGLECIWRYTANCTGTLHRWNAGNCDGDPDSIITITGMTVEFQVYDDSGTTKQYMTIAYNDYLYEAFRGDQVGGCSGAFNTNICTCAGPIAYEAGSGGSVSVS